MSTQERSKVFFALRTVKIDPQVYGVLALTIVATKVNFVCWHVPSSITTTPSYKATIVKFPRCNGNLTRLGIDVLVILPHPPNLIGNRAAFNQSINLVIRRPLHASRPVRLHREHLS
jgi:hypothetical protein